MTPINVIRERIVAAEAAKAASSEAWDRARALSSAAVEAEYALARCFREITRKIKPPKKSISREPRAHAVVAMPDGPCLVEIHWSEIRDRWEATAKPMPPMYDDPAEEPPRGPDDAPLGGLFKEEVVEQAEPTP